jgi:hypothetical protein
MALVGCTCYARGCGKKIRKGMLLCSAHWDLVPRTVKADLWRFYPQGDGNEMRPSPAWLAAANAAIEAVWFKERRAVPAARRRKA